MSTELDQNLETFVVRCGLAFGVAGGFTGAVADGIVVGAAGLGRSGGLAGIDVLLRRRVLDHLDLAVLGRGFQVLRLVGHAPPPDRNVRMRPARDGVWSGAWRTSARTSW